MDLTQQPGAPVEVAPNAFPTNRSTMCQKGWTSAELLRHPDRLTTPLMRDSRDGELEPAGWDAALDRVAGELRACAQLHGPDAIGVFGGGGLTNEKAYALGKFARVALRTSAIDYNGRFCMSSAATASGPSASIAACRFRSRTSPARGRSCSSARISSRRWRP